MRYAVKPDNKKHNRNSDEKLIKSDKIAQKSRKVAKKLIDMLEDSDDVQNVWHNWDND